MRHVRAISIVLMMAYGFDPAVRANGSASPTSPQPVYLEKHLDGKLPQEVLDELWALEAQGPLSFEQQLDMGIALALDGKADQAAGVFQGVAVGAKESDQRIVALVYAGQALGWAKKWQEAGEMANQAGKLAPDVEYIAALRVTFWQAAGDSLEAQVATDRLKQLDAKYDGKPVCEPMTTALIIVGVTAAVSLCTWTIVTRPSAADFNVALQKTLESLTNASLIIMAA